jgi:hypothetical protein
MNAAPGGELRAADGLWGPPARALREMLGRRYPEEHRPTWLSPGADQENSVLIGLLVAGWLTFRVAAPRLSPATTWGPSPANLIDANRPRGLTRDMLARHGLEKVNIDLGFVPLAACAPLAVAEAKGPVRQTWPR